MTCIRLSASDLRRRAWKATLATWPTLLGILFVIFALGEVQYHLMPLLALLLSVVTMFFQMGLTRGALTHLRGGEISFDHIGSMFPYWKQVICFYLWEGLFAFLWMLPGLLLVFMGALMCYSASGDPTLSMTAAAASGTMTAGTVIYLIGMVLMLVLLLRAALNYLLAGCCIIDNPHMGGAAALEKSKQLMRGHRWRFVCMSFPALLVIVAVAAVQVIFSDGMISTAHHALLSLLSIIPQLLCAYLVPVLYEELKGGEWAVHGKNNPTP
ncbi:MAG: DUF975 family protein [Clostridia bacterium]|nr:DUF975 family protein [Clostridia bacterium]